MTYLRAHTVYVRQALGHYLTTGLACQILTLVGGSMQTVEIMLFLCLLEPVLLSYQFIGIAQRSL